MPEANSFIGKKLSYYTSEQFPQFVQEEGPQLVKFIEKYYEWLSQVDEAAYARRNLSNYQDVDKAPAKFFDFLRNEFMQTLPKQLKTDERTLLKNIQDFFRSKGSEKSFRLLYRILYNEEIELYNPADDILRASDGRWLVESYIQIDAPIPDVNALIGSQIRGQTSKAKARVERIESFLDSGILTNNIYLSNKINTLQIGENIRDDEDNLIGAVTNIVNLPGRYINTKGHLSSDKFLQDNFFYQEYSYVIRSTVNFAIAKPVIDKLVHPAGTIFFNQFYTFSIIDLSSLFPLTDVVRSEFSVEFGDEITFATLDALTDLVEFLFELMSELLDPKRTFFEHFRIIYANTDVTLYGNTTINTVSNGNLLSVLYANCAIYIEDANGNPRFLNYLATAANNNTAFALNPFTGLSGNFKLYVEQGGQYGNTLPTTIRLFEDTFGENSNLTFGTMSTYNFADGDSRTILITNATSSQMNTDVFQFGTGFGIFDGTNAAILEAECEMVEFSNNFIRIASAPANSAVIVNDKYARKTQSSKITSYTP